MTGGDCLISTVLSYTWYTDLHTPPVTIISSLPANTQTTVERKIISETALFQLINHYWLINYYERDQVKGLPSLVYYIQTTRVGGRGTYLSYNDEGSCSNIVWPLLTLLLSWWSWYFLPLSHTGSSALMIPRPLTFLPN